MCNMIDHCKINHSSLSISNLEEGHYQVYINYTNFQIEVIKGHLIHNSSLIITDTQQVNALTHHDYVQINEVNLHDNTLSIQTNK